MIDRYTYPEMKRVWSEENKLEQWLRVEILACEGWAEQGAIPAEALDAIRRASVEARAHGRDLSARATTT